ncbi:hypothetical protein CI102_6950 [Trichoderma harzianum]|nr:hypothetical protein CI102_6950 [Trichoderma harzianum]
MQFRAQTTDDRCTYTHPQLSCSEVFGFFPYPSPLNLAGARARKHLATATARTSWVAQMLPICPLHIISLAAFLFLHAANLEASRVPPKAVVDMPPQKYNWFPKANKAQKANRLIGAVAGLPASSTL